jgi:CelD/BcsL family acetyltransferase involved in cellulose biosynthesis
MPSLGRWADAWDRLGASLPLPSPFLRSWWLEAVAGELPSFVLVTDGPTLIGGLAVQNEPRGRLDVTRVMGAGPLCPDHIDRLAEPGREEEVDRVLRPWWRRRGSRLIDLDGVAAGSRLTRTLPGTVRQWTTAGAPYLKVPPDPDTYLMSRSANFRANLRKASRRLVNDGVIHRVAPPAPVEATLENLRSLHTARWGKSRFIMAFDQFSAAARAGAARGEFFIHELVVGDRPIASIACFDLAERVSLYQAGRDPDRRWRSAETVLLNRIIEDAIRRRLFEVDFLRGAEAYKWSFASDERPVLHLRAATGVAGRLGLMGSLARDRARAAAGRVIARGRSRAS